MRIPISLLFLLSCLQATAQFRFQEDTSIPVTIQGTELLRPWEGGVNSGQFQKMDLNNDNIEDLIIYHRISGEITTYLAEENEFVYSPDYKHFFPDVVTDWLVLADFNCDGRKDIFTSTPLGITVFENTSSGSTPSWNQAVDFITFDSNINLQVNASDIPGIADIDGDGDLDILAYRFSTSNTIDYYRNLSVENTSSCGQLIFTRETRRWGDLEECDCNSFAFGQTCASLGGVANPTSLVNAPDAAEHAGGKTILPIDMDNDGDMDLITSDEFCETLYFMENVGTSQLAQMTGFVDFPASSPAGFYIFPAAFFEDINFDGQKDLIISSNADDNIGNLIDFTNTSRVSLNTGTTTEPTFSTTFTAFLQNEMIDLGEVTYPAFVDIDGDSDLDLLVGNRGTLIDGELRGTLSLFENTGTRLRPAFTLVETDYLNLSTERLRNVKPQFTDLDNDGDTDLVYQATVIDGNTTSIRYRLNQGDFNLGPENIINLSVLENDQYHFARIDEDNAPDLLIGNRLGSLTLYLNEGGLTFGEGHDDFAGVTSGFNTRNPSVIVADVNNDNNKELVITDITGNLKILTGSISANFTPENTIASLFENGLTNSLEASLLSELTPFTVADLFGDGRPALIVGNNRGGLSVYRNLSSGDGGSGAANIEVFAFPNPATSSVFLQSNSNGQLDVYTITGQRILEGVSVSSTEELEISTGNMPAGLYLFRVTNGSGKPGITKVVVQH